MAVDELLVWSVRSYNIQTDKRVERLVIAKDAKEAMVIAYESGLFSPSGGHQIQPAGRLLRSNVLAMDEERVVGW